MSSAELKDRIKGKPEITRIFENNQGAVFIGWKEAKGAQEYIVEKFNRDNQRFEKLTSLNSETLEFVDTKVEAACVYRYRIAARRKNSNGDVITKRGANTSVSLSTSEVFELCEVSHPSFGVAKLTWEKDENADGYKINRRLSLTNRTLPVAFVEGQTLKYTDKTLVSGQIYFYSVQSFRRSEDDELIFSKIGKERIIVNLDKPEILSVKKGRERTINFTVRVTASAESYVLFKSKEENGEFVEVARSKSGTDFTVSDERIKKEKGAYYTIKCMRTFEGKEYFGDGTEPVYVKY